MMNQQLDQRLKFGFETWNVNNKWSSKESLSSLNMNPATGTWNERALLHQNAMWYVIYIYTFSLSASASLLLSVISIFIMNILFLILNIKRYVYIERPSNLWASLYHAYVIWRVSYHSRYRLNDVYLISWWSPSHLLASDNDLLHLLPTQLELIFLGVSPSLGVWFLHL